MTIEQRTVQTLQLLQQNQNFERTYGFVPSIGTYARATLEQRCAIVHFLLQTLDEARAKSAFQQFVKLKPFKIAQVDRFKEVCYAWVKDLQIEMPLKAEFLQHNARNARMVYNLSQIALEIQILRLSRKLSVNVEKVTAENANELLLQCENAVSSELHRGNADFQKVQAASEQLIKLMHQLDLQKQKQQKITQVQQQEDLGDVKLTKHRSAQQVQPDVNTKINQLSQCFQAQYLDINNMVYLEKPFSLNINTAELRFLQNAVKKQSDCIQLESVFKGLKMQLQSSKPVKVEEFRYKDLLEQIMCVKREILERKEIITQQINQKRSLQPGFADKPLVRFDKPEFNLIDSRIYDQEGVTKKSLLKESLGFFAQNEKEAKTLAQRLREMNEGENWQVGSTHGGQVLKASKVEMQREFLDVE
uniref:Uncharacterized protein n=1 Tax=Trepomonas sp. PC1 TaxID=1076344 RepID=A0A146K3R4_9EUKA|eukprot:JAP91550.1 hypothetical protein TPC1_16806 [Trepomonas sp. PC1]